mmetsp:Transcript_40386/g.48406  ORF Transcript_40386/g.48406 Transcript_40386/m.48406 type:complete len:100 (+) Transcript_40386:178-477(+)
MRKLYPKHSGNKCGMHKHKYLQFNAATPTKRYPVPTCESIVHKKTNNPNMKHCQRSHYYQQQAPNNPATNTLQISIQTTMTRERPTPKPRHCNRPLSKR